MKSLFASFIFLLYGLLASFICYPATNEWQADVIDVVGRPPVNLIEDYSAQQGDAWDFDENDMEGISDWKNLQQFEITDGYLKFKTRKNTVITWGDADLDTPSAGELVVAEDWKPHYWPWVIQIKVKQSLKASEWFAEASYRLHGRPHKLKREAVLTGEKEQVLQFDMGNARDRYFALRIGTKTAGNEITIDWVKVVRASTKKEFRISFDLSTEPISSKLYFSTNGMISIYANGNKLGTHGTKPPFGRRLNRYKKIEHLHKGRNEICVSLEGYVPFSSVKKSASQFFFMEGIVIDENGKRTNIVTNSKWMGQYADSSCSAYSDKKGRSVFVKGKVRDYWPLLQGIADYERYGDPPYLGSIHINFDEDQLPIFYSKKTVAIDVKVLGKQGDNSEDEIHYSLYPWENDIRSQKVMVSSNIIAGSSGIIKFEHLEPGVYELIIEYKKNGTTLDRRSQEVTVVGNIDQKEIYSEDFMDGLILKKVHEISFKSGAEQEILCAEQDGKNARWLENKNDGLSAIHNLAKASIRDDVLSLPANYAAWCSVKFNVEELYKPHIVEIEYPAGGSRDMAFVIAEDTRYPNIHNVGKVGAITRLNNGVYTEPVSNIATHTSRYIYWPNRKNATFTAVNAGRYLVDRGAISKLTVYEIQNNLPAFHLQADINKKNRMIGPFVERIDRSTANLFYSGPLEAKFSRSMIDSEFSGAYNAWYQTFSNLIQYLRFSGQNTYYAGIYMYHGGWFVSDRFQGTVARGMNNFPAGWNDFPIHLLAMMFEENNMNLILGVQFIGSPSLLKMDTVSDEEVRLGKDTIRFVRNDGRQARGFQGQGFNFMSESVQTEIFALVDEIGKKFSKYSAIKGITWMRLPEYPWSKDYDNGSPMDVGYGDQTIDRYRTETNSGIPVLDDSPDRFHKRWRWLIKNEMAKWVEWRSKKVYELDKRIADKFSHYRSDWKTWRLVTRPIPQQVKLWSKGDIDVRDVYRHAGIDPLLYEENSNLSLMQLYDIGAEKKYALRSIKKLAGSVKSFYNSNERKELFSKAQDFAHVGFRIETILKTKENWPWKSLLVISYSVPASKGLRDALDFSIEKKDINAIAIGWSDQGHFSGNEQDIRRYMLEY